jgi:hypothetical protein
MQASQGLCEKSVGLRGAKPDCEAEHGFALGRDCVFGCFGSGGMQGCHYLGVTQPFLF